MDSPALLLLGMSQITQLSPTTPPLITLGQLPNVPLMWSPSELLDGLEPHGIFYSGYMAVRQLSMPGPAVGGEEVYPGWCGSGWVPGGYYTGYYPPTDPEAGLTLI